MKKVLALTMALAMVAASFAGCGNSSSSASTTAAAAETTVVAGETAAAAEGTGTVKIGMSGPLTGGASAYGLAVKAGMEVAVEEINAKGGLQIEFNAQDDEADGEKAVSAYNVLKDWGMQVMAGQVTTGAALAVAPESVADNMFNLTPSASAEALATSGANVFQMCFTDPNQGASAAELVSTKYTGSKVGIIYDSSDDYSTGLYNGFSSKAAEAGVEIVATTSFTADNKADLSTQVTKCQEAGADLVFLPIYYTEASQILTYANRIGYAPKFFGCDGMDGILTVEGFDTSLAEGLALMTPFDANAADEATQSFVSKFKEKMNGLVPNQFAADGYDVIYAIYDALTAAGITGTESASDICTALEAQFATMTVDGLTGTGMHWDENGMISKAPAAVVIENGVYVPMG
ncbi:MAG: ABC transporter substrate-binding protein [Candidatus Faecousia sp.]|nr:ABC transporter substrate-binding protein [Candidatus Faecousia sp.]